MHDHHPHHPHDHDHDHHGSELSPMEARVRALESILVEKGLVEPAALDAIIDTYETKIGPRNGAKVVARAWCDAAYAQKLREDATAAVAEFGFSGRRASTWSPCSTTATRTTWWSGTLCSCYPWPVLGLPPVWYKSAPYRSRVVIDPRGVLAEFGLQCRRANTSASGTRPPRSATW